MMNKALKLQECVKNGFYFLINFTYLSQYCVMRYAHNRHCQDTMLKIRNKYSQTRNLRGLSPNFHIHVSLSDLHISMIGLPILLQENMLD